MKVFPYFGAHPQNATLLHTFPSGAKVKFAHLEHERTVFDWQGSQIALIGFDELTHFTEDQFFYMLSRNRSMSGVPGYVRATCNPDVDSWVRKFIDWWIDKNGDPIPEHLGVIRFFIRQNDEIIWGASRQELTDKYGEDCKPKSFTFIAANIFDNKILMEKDPSYLANLKALSRVQRMRLLGGNWNVRAASGLYFQREWFPVVDVIPGGWSRIIRYWDRASTKPNEANRNPDWTVGLKLYSYPDGTFVVADVRRMRDTPAQVRRFMKNTAQQDGYDVAVGLEQEPGSSGQADIDDLVRMLAGYEIIVNKPSTDKITRAEPVSSQVEHGNMKVLRAPWNEDFFKETENFPPDEAAGLKSFDNTNAGHDDQVDALSGAFNEIAGQISTLDVL